MSLPVEVIAGIIGFVSVSELFSLHLVSREVSSLTYEFFNGIVINPDMSLEERAKYKMMREEFINTTCYTEDCSNNSKGQLYCSKCFETEDFSRDIYLADYICEGKATVPIYIVDLGDYSLGFVKSGPYMVCKGVQYVKTMREIDPHYHELNGHKYEPPVKGNRIKYRRCVHTSLVAENPPVVDLCHQVINGDSLPDPSSNFCYSHNKNGEGHLREDQIPEGALIVSDNEGKYIVMKGEFDGCSLHVERDGSVSSCSIPREGCERLGIRFKGADREEESFGYGTFSL